MFLSLVYDETRRFPHPKSLSPREKDFEGFSVSPSLLETLCERQDYVYSVHLLTSPVPQAYKPQAFLQARCSPCVQELYAHQLKIKDQKRMDQIGR